MSQEDERPSAEDLRRRVEEAREAYERAREAERDSRREEWRADRSERREARRERRRWSRSMSGGLDLDLGSVAGDFVRDFVGVGESEATEELTDTVNGRFAVSGMPRVRVRNVAGSTRVKTGASGEVLVVARKRVWARTAEQAKRLLEAIDFRMEQQGDEVSIAPHFEHEERGWFGVFRGGRIAVDIEVTVPSETRLDAHTVSGELAVAGTRGPIDVQSVSGDVTIEDVQGPMRLRTVSGEATVRRFAGALDANSVSGDLRFEASRLHGASLVTVSGDVDVDGELDADRDHRVRTISGDVDLALAGASYTVEFRSMSGDARSTVEAQITREGKRDRTIVIGSGGTRVRVKTVSGDLQVDRSSSVAPEATPAEGGPDASAAAPAEPNDGASAHEDEPPHGGPADGAAGARGRILRIRVVSGGTSKVNIAIPLAVARMGKAKIAASGLVRAHLAKFGIDLDDVLRSLDQVGHVVDISDDEDRIVISVE